MKAHEFLIEAEATKSYEIKPGDTLTKIASRNNTTIDAIMDLNRGTRAIRDRDTIYAGGTIKIPTASTGTDSDARVKRQGATSVNKTDDVAKIGNQKFPLTKGPGAPGANDDMSGKNFGIDDPDWESPTAEPDTQHPVGTVVKLDWSKTPYRDLGPLIKKPNGSWYTLDGKNRATDKKVISMAEKASPVPKSSSDNARQVPGGGASNVKLPTRPDQLRPEEKDISPIPGAQMTDRFGSPRGGRTHQGIDLRAIVGTEVVAPNNGKVLDVGYGPTTGTYLTLGDMQGNKTHRFMHLSKTLADQGEIVKQGQVIAKSGKSGFSELTNKAYPPHLHWEKYVNGEPVDPSKYVELPTKS
jgi:murein DD-endopeptidase MepM/ murein hydrolase activator NlpD